MKLQYIHLIVLTLCSVISCKNSVKHDSQVSQQLEEDFKYTNALIKETSPYLLQHAHNPVDWMPWGQKAFDLAEHQNKLVVLSIGYSSCHWCFVMEEESFEDEQVAKLMNEYYISIKVDRDERPDVDAVYQTALQMVNGFGGWPLNAIILPNGKPVYLGTYHEKEKWMTVLSNFRKEYALHPEKVHEYANLLTKGVQETYELPISTEEDAIGIEDITTAIHQWSKDWDTIWGGDIGEQKFVVPSKMELLLDYGILNKNLEAQEHVKNTLDVISISGIHDHLGGGFFRYTTDAEWKVPHFEKMLYDNAQLLKLYARAYRVFKDQQYKFVVEKTFGFLNREMKSVEGGYYSSLDASTDGTEGAYYTWTTNELKSVLKDNYDDFFDFFGKTALKESQLDRFILFQKYPDSIFAVQHGMNIQEVRHKRRTWQTKLNTYRKRREAPKKDDKVISSWNALLIDAYIEAYRAFGEEKYLKAAEETFAALRKHNFKNGRPLHSYKTNSTQDNAFLEDYAFLANSAWNLYRTTHKKDYQYLAKSLTQKALHSYVNPDSPLFYYSASSKLIAKVVDREDGVLPSSNAAMARNLSEIGQFDHNTRYLDQSTTMLGALVPEFLALPQNYGQWGRLMLENALPFYEIVIIGPEADVLVKRIREHYLPNTLIVSSKTESNSFLFKNRYVDATTLIYICRNNTCKLPVKSVKEAIKQLRELGYPTYMEQGAADSYLW